jgi:DNA-binding GntR family transcriptional regulator
MTRDFVRQGTDAQIAQLKDHVTQEKAAVARGDVPHRTDLLGDFHVLMAHLLGNHVLAQILDELLSRCALITLMYQTSHAAEHSAQEHDDILQAIVARNENQAAQLMSEHLNNVQANLSLDRKMPTNDISAALS